MWKILVVILILTSSNSENVTLKAKQNRRAVISIFKTMGQLPGPCRYIQTNRKQNRFCKRDSGFPDVLEQMQHLVVTQCQNQFFYDRWNCSISIRGRRSIFAKVYRETAFIYALISAAMTHSISRACSMGKMTRCHCADERDPEQTRLAWRYGGCSDNIKYGKRLTRNFFSLRDANGDTVSEILRHNSEVGMQSVVSTMEKKCKCHGISGSCSMKSCYRKLSNFNKTASLLRLKYDQAMLVRQSNEQIRHKKSKPKKKKHKDKPKDEILHYIEPSPVYCSTENRRCLNSSNCAKLCCGRGYSTLVILVKERCKCRFVPGKYYVVKCETCERYEDQFFCK